MTLLEEIKAKCSPELLATRDSQAIADKVNQGRTKISDDYWLTDRGMVADITKITGNTDMSSSILTKLDGMALQDRSTKAIVDRLKTDAKGINFGDPALRAHFDMLGSAGLLEESEVMCLLMLAVQPDPVTEYQVRCAIWADNGDYLA